MTECTRCGAPAQQFLCTRCVSRACATLRRMPWLLHQLDLAALGRVNLGDIGRHIPYRSRHELRGDAPLWSLVEPLPDENTDLGTARRERQQNALRRILAAGGVNARARELHDATINMLSTWIRDLCEIRGLDVPDDIEARPGGVCGWLIGNIGAIAGHEAADEFCDELAERAGQAQRMINRPKPPVPIGPCTAPDPDGQAGHCGHQITTFNNATHVSCPRCDSVHNVNELARENLDATDELWCTKDELMFILATMGTPIADGRLRLWRHRGNIRQRLLPDGTPQYHLGDARTMADRATVKQNQRAVAMPESDQPQ